MMPPAARPTDATAHGTPLAPGPGSTTTLIGFLPAWRAVPAAAAAGLQAALEATSKAIKALEETTKAAPDPTSKAAAVTAETTAKASAVAAMSSAMAAFDMHMCAMPSAPVPAPHGPGVVLQGSSSVLIDFMPAARQGDKVVETLGGPDPITGGCTTVIIGG
ncbi:MAG: PAAR domain-containing protein [Acidobacteria bacterium]|nr:PAAR domain-containing protein [Acidobacteriota bacterium]